MTGLKFAIALPLATSGVIAGAFADAKEAGSELSGMGTPALLGVAVVALCVVLLWLVRRILAMHDGLVTLIKEKTASDTEATEALKAQTAVAIEMKDAMQRVGEGMEWCRKSDIEKRIEAQREDIH